MQFTEYELTAAVTGAAKSILASKKIRKRSKAIEAEWAAMERYQRFKLLDAVGTQVLPVLIALPDVEVAPGERATYTNKQVEEVVETLVADDLGRIKRAVAVKARVALVQTALGHLPERARMDTDDTES